MEMMGGHSVCVYRECVIQDGGDLERLLLQVNPHKESRRKTDEVTLEYRRTSPEELETHYILERPVLRISHPNLRGRAGRNCRQKWHSSTTNQDDIGLGGFAKLTSDQAG